jgi:hypothetical protein
MRTPRRLLAILALGLLLDPIVASAQAVRTARIQGVVFDSLKMRPQAGATVTVSRVSPEPQEYATLSTDAQGRYRTEPLIAGRYEVAWSSALLDSLEVVMPAQTVTLADGAVATVDFAGPSGATLRAASCPGLQLRPGQGAVVGRVTNLETGQALTNAVVAVSWPDLRLDPVTRKPTNEMLSGGVRADSLGLYRLCGVPTAIHLLIQVQRDDRVGSVIELAVPDDAGVSVLDLVYSPKDSRSADDASPAPVASADSSVKAPVAAVTGAAALTGTVRAPSGAPVSDVQVQLVDAGTPVRTGSDGRFTLTNLPSGTQLLETRKVGYRIGRYPVTLRPGATVTQDVIMERIITLDSVRIVAQRSVLKEFDQRRRTNGFGTYVLPAQLERRKPELLSDLMRQYGFVVRGEGIDAKLYSGRGMKSFQLGPCPVNVVIDRIPNQDINLLDWDMVGGIEIYRGIGGAPPPYEAGCGLIIIWTKL